MYKIIKAALLAISVSILMSCGGGGGSGGNAVNPGSSSSAASRSWSSATTLGAASDITYVPQLAINASGAMVAAWNQRQAPPNAAYVGIYTSRYTPTGGWSTATLLSGNASDAYNPQVAIDASGNAFVVWQQLGTTAGVYAARYSAANSSWGTGALLGSNTIAGETPLVEADGNGNAIAVWRQVDINNVPSLYASRYTLGGWGAATLLEVGTGNVYSSSLAVNAMGNAVVVWFQYDGATGRIYANSYVANLWTGAQAIDNSSLPMDETDVDMDANGNVLAVYTRLDSSGGATHSIWSVRYSNPGGWSATPVPAEATTGDARNPQVAIDGNGNTTAVWHEGSTGARSIYANRYVNGSWLTTATVLETGSGDALYPRLAVTSDGIVQVVWWQVNGVTTSVFSSRFSSNSWGTAGLVETEAAEAFDSQVVLDNSSNAIAIWAQGSYGSSTSIKTARYQ